MENLFWGILLYTLYSDGIFSLDRDPFSVQQGTTGRFHYCKIFWYSDLSLIVTLLPFPNCVTITNYHCAQLGRFSHRLVMDGVSCPFRLWTDRRSPDTCCRIRTIPSIVIRFPSTKSFRRSN